MTKPDFYRILKRIEPTLATPFYTFNPDDKIYIKNKSLEFSPDGSTLTVSSKEKRCVTVREYDLSNASDVEIEEIICEILYNEKNKKVIDIIRQSLWDNIPDDEQIHFIEIINSTEEDFIKYLSNEDNLLCLLQNEIMTIDIFEKTLSYIGEYISTSNYRIGDLEVYIHNEFDVELSRNKKCLIVDCVGKYSNGTLVYVIQKKSGLVLRNCKCVEAYGNGSIDVYGDTHIIAHRYISLELYDNATCIAYDTTDVIAHNNTSVHCKSEHVVVYSYNNTHIVVENVNIVNASDKSTIVLCGSAITICKKDNVRLINAGGSVNLLDLGNDYQYDYK